MAKQSGANKTLSIVHSACAWPSLNLTHCMKIYLTDSNMCLFLKIAKSALDHSTLFVYVFIYCSLSAIPHPTDYWGGGGGGGGVGINFHSKYWPLVDNTIYQQSCPALLKIFVIFCGSLSNISNILWHS